MKEETFDHVEAYRLYCEGVALEWLVSDDKGDETFEFFDQGFFDENWVGIKFRRKPREFEDGAWYPVEFCGGKCIATYSKSDNFFYFVCHSKDSGDKGIPCLRPIISEYVKIGEKLEINWPE